MSEMTERPEVLSVEGLAILGLLIDKLDGMYIREIEESLGKRIPYTRIRFMLSESARDGLTRERRRRMMVRRASASVLQYTLTEKGRELVERTLATAIPDE